LVGTGETTSDNTVTLKPQSVSIGNSIFFSSAVYSRLVRLLKIIPAVHQRGNHLRKHLTAHFLIPFSISSVSS